MQDTTLLPKAGKKLVSSEQEVSEHDLIKERLAITFSFMDLKRGRWTLIDSRSEIDCDQHDLTLRCKYARQTLRLPYPFHLDSDLLYLWGLIAGSSYHKGQLEICVDANQADRLLEIGQALGISPKIMELHRSRHKTGAIRRASYRKIAVQFPSVLLKLFYCLGHRPRMPQIPYWLDIEQRVAWLTGYLNSPKVQCRIRKQRGIDPSITILIAENSPKLLQDIAEVLDSLGIARTLYRFQGRPRLIIQNLASLRTLLTSFPIQRPKIRALRAILQEKNPALRLAIRKFTLSEFQIVLLGLLLDQPAQELEYTLFEDTFACSSNEIRQNLYELDRKGLLNYYKKENNKEYLIQTTRYLNHVAKQFDSEKKELARQLKYSDSNALSFHCKKCDEVVDYADAMGDATFRCPHCDSRQLEPMELTRYFYYGHLGRLAHFQNVMDAGVV